MSTPKPEAITVYLITAINKKEYDEYLLGNDYLPHWAAEQAVTYEGEEKTYQLYRFVGTVEIDETKTPKIFNVLTKKLKIEFDYIGSVTPAPIKLPKIPGGQPTGPKMFLCKKIKKITKLVPK